MHTDGHRASPARHTYNSLSKQSNFQASRSRSPWTVRSAKRSAATVRRVRTQAGRRSTRLRGRVGDLDPIETAAMDWIRFAPEPRTRDAFRPDLPPQWPACQIVWWGEPDRKMGRSLNPIPFRPGRSACARRPEPGSRPRRACVPMHD